jgi:hypothetical protein
LFLELEYKFQNQYHIQFGLQLRYLHRHPPQKVLAILEHLD